MAATGRFCDVVEAAEGLESFHRIRRASLVVLEETLDAALQIACSFSRPGLGDWMKQSRREARQRDRRVG